MRILHLYKDYAPVFGGIENHVRVLAGGLRKGVWTPDFCLLFESKLSSNGSIASP